ncbi:MAG TPA: hypothetical protein VMG59_07190 [Phycisphaerae bacterium]|nr:hypothetical protein [Phycisphaerae bacterium]
MNDQNDIPASSDNDAPREPTRLTVQEAAYVDALLAQGSDPGADLPPVPTGPEAEQLARIRNVFQALSKLPEQPAPADLSARTLAAIRKNRVDPHDLDTDLHTLTPGSSVLRHPKISWGRKNADVAVMLVAASLMVVVLIFGLLQAREKAVRYACQDNLEHIGSALGQYAVVYAGMLPEIAPPRDRNWLPPELTPGEKRSPDEHSNLANLSPLVQGPTPFTSWDRFVCPAVGLPSRIDSLRAQCDNSSYSYLDQLARFHHRFNEAGQIAVLADCNPIFSGHHITSGNINSFNHDDGDGQNILWDDGSVDWVTTPDVGPDHNDIWTIGDSSHIVYTGFEEPQNPDNVVLVP